METQEIIVVSTQQLSQIIEDAVCKAISKYENKDKTTSPEIEYLTPEEVAKRLNISLVTLWTYDKKGITKPLRMGNLKRYRKGDLESIFESIPTNQAKRGRKKHIQ
jgi:hypothetical protein